MATEPERPANHTSSRPPLPSPFSHTTPPPTLYYQGAEALLYRTHFLLSPTTSSSTASASVAAQTSTPSTAPTALKHRPPKPYRHPLLDAKLTRHRILSEARILARLRRDGIDVPALYALDWERGWIMMEWVGGGSVRGVLDRELAGWLRRDGAAVEEREEDTKGGEGLWGLMGRIGRVVGRMHESGVVHGDLTTSNLLLRDEKGGGGVEGEQEASGRDDLAGVESEVVLIDFGLASVSTDAEDRGVDLYVLERAFGSTHRGTEKLFGEILRAYGESYKGAKGTLKRYEEVRMRGRKKIMIG